METSLNKEFRSQISPNPVNHFKKFKLQCDEHTKNYKKHVIIWRKKRFETLLGFEEI